MGTLPNDISKPTIEEREGQFVVINNGVELAVCRHRITAERLVLVWAAEPGEMIDRIREAWKDRAWGWDGQAASRFRAALEQVEEIWKMRLEKQTAESVTAARKAWGL